MFSSLVFVLFMKTFSRLWITRKSELRDVRCQTFLSSLPSIGRRKKTDSESRWAEAATAFVAMIMWTSFTVAISHRYRHSSALSVFLIFTCTSSSYLARAHKMLFKVNSIHIFVLFTLIIFTLRAPPQRRQRFKCSSRDNEKESVAISYRNLIETVLLLSFFLASIRITWYHRFIA